MAEREFADPSEQYAFDQTISLAANFNFYGPIRYLREHPEKYDRVMEEIAKVYPKNSKTPTLIKRQIDEALSKKE